jgi:hypothetical protein
MALAANLENETGVSGRKISKSQLAIDPAGLNHRRHRGIPATSRLCSTPPWMGPAGDI